MIGQNMLFNNQFAIKILFMPRMPSAVSLLQIGCWTTYSVLSSTINMKFVIVIYTLPLGRLYLLHFHHGIRPGNERKQIKSNSSIFKSDFDSCPCGYNSGSELLYSGKFFADENFRDLKVKVCEIIFAIFIFAISNEPTFELGDRIKRWLCKKMAIPACS